MEKAIQKLTKWMQKAYEATTRKEALKAARKYEKWHQRLKENKN